MIFLYIILYLVVGLVVKWLFERSDGCEFRDGSLAFIVFWPTIFALFPLYYAYQWVIENGLPKPYIKIRKFFRGF